MSDVCAPTDVVTPLAPAAAAPGAEAPMIGSSTARTGNRQRSLRSKRIAFSNLQFAISLLLVAATFPLLWVGGLVTTTAAGMAVPDWPTTYGYNLFLYPWQTWVFGPWDLFIEHGHRLLGAAVGLVTIGLLACLRRCEDRPWLKRLGIVALVLVIVQGVLGGMRVILDERLLAMIHACTGPLFFALAVAFVVFTSQSWRCAGRAGTHAAASQTCSAHAGVFRRLAVLTFLLIYVQLVLGAVVRHMPVAAEPSTFATAVKFHVLLGIALLVQVCWLVWLAVRYFRSWNILRNLALLLGVLLAGQLALGASTWAVKYSVAQWAGGFKGLSAYTIHAGGWLQTHVVTAHVAVGSLLLATTAALALYTLRLVPAAHAAPRGSFHRMEVVV